MKKKLLLGLIAFLTLLVLLLISFSERDIPRQVLEAKYATPPSQFVTLADGARVHYRDRGPRDAPVLLLLHGSNASLFTFEPWSKLLSDQFRVVSVDLPGHGLTGTVPNDDYSIEGMAQFTAQFADKIGLGKFALAGNSMGGAVAALFAEVFPERVSKLILIDPAGMTTKFGGHIPLMFWLAKLPVVNQVFLHITPRAFVVRGAHDAIARKSIINDTMIDMLWELNLMEGTRMATLKRFSMKLDPYVAEHIHDIKAPTLILWGDKDELIAVENAQAWTKALPSAKLIIYTDTGHIPMEEVAEQSSADVRAFLNASQ